MGLALILGAILLILLIVGVLGVLIGTIMLIVRHIKKKKTQKNYKVVKVLGIIFIILGGLAALIPLGLAGTAVLGVKHNEKCQAYWAEQVDTNKEIVVEKGVVNEEGACHHLESFEYYYRQYHRIDGMTLDYKDKYRKEAVANITDGKNTGTVYKFEHPKGEDMLSINYDIFATENSIKQLTKYYNDKCEFSYICDYYLYEGSGEFKVKMEDDMYIGIINCKPEYISDVNDDYKRLHEYDIIQKSDDGRIERCLEINVCEDDRFVIQVKENPLGKSISNKDKVYEVIDKESKKKLLEIDKKILKRVN